MDTGRRPRSIWALVVLVLVACNVGCAGMPLATGRNQISLSPGSASEQVDGVGNEPSSWMIQTSYARRWVHNDKMDLYGELPVTIIPRTLPAPAIPTLPRDYSSFLFAPGLRMHFPTRLSYFFDFGGGIGRFKESDRFGSGETNKARHTAIGPVFMFASGEEFQMTPRFGVRGELRFFFGESEFPTVRAADYPKAVRRAATVGLIIHY